MELEHLFSFQDRLRGGALRARPRYWISDPFAALRGKEQLPNPLICDQFLGRTPGDVIGTGWAILYLISDRVVETLQREGCTGWRAHPAEVHAKGDKLIPGYHLLIVTGRCGPIDKSQSPEVRLDPPGPRGRATRGSRGIYFDPATWDGSDLFVPEGSGWIIVVERVKDALQRAKVTNIEFERLTDIEQMLLLPTEPVP